MGFCWDHWVRYVDGRMIEKRRQEHIGYARNVDLSLKRKDRNALAIWIKAMEIGKKLGCHQKPERSFSYKGYQFPVCARCTGIIISTLFTYGLYSNRQLSIGISVLFLSAMVCDGLLQHFGIKDSNNARRFVTGCLGGIGLTSIRLRLYSKIWNRLKRLA